MALSADLDIMGQHPMLRLMYTNLSYVFALNKDEDDVTADSIIQTLTEGLQRLSASFPWIAGQVAKTEGDSGSFKIVPFEDIPRLQTEHRPDLSIQTFKEANWCMKLLDANVFAPRLIPLGQAPKLSDTTPVLLLRATFITGAVVLTFAATHCAMDMTAQTVMIGLLDKACRGVAFTEEELRVGNRELGGEIELLNDLGDDELKAEMALQLSREPVHPKLENDEPQKPAKFVWGYFHVGNESLVALKEKATESSLSGFVSTDDALTALIWQSISRARQNRLDKATKVLLARAVDVRKAIGIPEAYPGMMQNMAFNILTIKDLLDAPLGVVASQLRSKLDPEALGRVMKVVLTLMSRHPNQSPITGLNPSHDVMVTSWAKMDCYGGDFSLGLGKPENVLRPSLPFGEGWVNFMPRSLDGGIAFGVCLKEEDMDALKRDGEFGGFVQYVG